MSYHLGQCVFIPGKNGPVPVYIVKMENDIIYDVPGGRTAIRYGINRSKPNGKSEFTVGESQILGEWEEENISKGYN